MAEVINMPRLSDTMEEGVVAKWLKQKGDKVEEGDILAEIETDKATMEFESFYEGVLLHIGVEEGETAPVDQLLAIIGEEGEDISDLLNGSSASGSKSDKEDKKSSESDNEESNDEEKTDEKEESSSDDSGIPEGVEIITMPRLSDTMEEGTVATWLKQEGDTIEEGDILAEIETDKATMEFESFYSGTLLKIGVAEGETAKVDKLLAIIGPEGTDVSGISGDSPKASKAETKSTLMQVPVLLVRKVVGSMNLFILPLSFC
jgi:pyruvate dehydrogenase E2 component (dihydrolipoamide acetyltransferase)